MDHELHGTGDHKRPVENRGGRPLFLQLLKRFGEAERHEEERDAEAHRSSLVVTHLDSIEVECTHRVRGNQAIQRQDLVHLEGGRQGGSTLSDHLLYSLDRRVLEGEGRCDACVTEFKLVTARERGHFLLEIGHLLLLVCLNLCHGLTLECGICLHLFHHGHRIHTSHELLPLLLFFLGRLTVVNDSQAHICSLQRTDIIRTISTHESDMTLV